jgi:hypothetical protein
MSIPNMPLPKNSSDEEKPRPLPSYYLTKFEVGKNGLLRILSVKDIEEKFMSSLPMDDKRQSKLIFLNMIHNKNIYYIYSPGDRYWQQYLQYYTLPEECHLLITDDWVFIYSTEEQVRNVLTGLVGQY